MRYLTFCARSRRRSVINAACAPKLNSLKSSSRSLYPPRPTLPAISSRKDPFAFHSTRFLFRSWARIRNKIAASQPSQHRGFPSARSSQNDFDVVFFSVFLNFWAMAWSIFAICLLFWWWCGDGVRGRRRWRSSAPGGRLYGTKRRLIVRSHEYHDDDEDDGVSRRENSSTRCRCPQNTPKNPTTSLAAFQQRTTTSSIQKREKIDGRWIFFYSKDFTALNNNDDDDDDDVMY